MLPETRRRTERYLKKEKKKDENSLIIRGNRLARPLAHTDIENTSWKVRAYGIYARVVDVSEIERVSAANE